MRFTRELSLLSIRWIVIVYFCSAVQPPQNKCPNHIKSMVQNGILSLLCIFTAFLGPCSKLGSSHSRHHRYEEEPRDYQWQDDLRPVLLFTALHEVRLQGAATQLASVCLPFYQWGSTANPGKSSHQIQNGEEDGILIAVWSRCRTFTAEWHPAASTDTYTWTSKPIHLNILSYHWNP